jgi:hypothetical protein
MSQNKAHDFSHFKKIILIVCCLILFPSLAHADSQNPDGNDWNSMDDRWKIGYVQGFVHSSINVFMGAIITGNAPDQKLTHYMIQNVTIGHLIDGLDVLYADFKNRTIPLVFSIYVVYKQIKGTSQGDIEKILLWLRTGGNAKNKDKYLTIKDHEGKVVRIINFP